MNMIPLAAIGCDARARRTSLPTSRIDGTNELSEDSGDQQMGE